jgi:hypothetical protein
LDQRIDEIVLRALERERELRQKSAQQLKTELEHIAVADGLGKTAPELGGSGSPIDSPNGAVGVNTGAARRQLGGAKPFIAWGTAALAVIAVLVVFVLSPNWRGRDQAAPAADLPALQAGEIAKRDQSFKESVRLLQQRLEDLRTRYSAGEVSTGEVVKAVRDLALAQARGDTVAFAQANLDYADWLLEVARKEGNDAKIWAAELSRAQALLAVNVARVRGDKVKVAQADLEHAQAVYALAQKHHQNGTIDDKQLRAAQRGVTQTESYLNHLLQPK